MKRNKKNKYAISAQGMVEFALALPILLGLVFGLFEVGRMAFTYITIITASREAVRYGSATGDVTTIGSFSKRYADCDGIREAAQKVNFLQTFSDTDIVITYDHGLLSDGTPVEWGDVGCQNGLNPPLTISTADRINVQVTGTFIPIINIFNVLMTNTDGSTDPITLQSFNSHTILGNVAIEKPWQGGGGGGEGGGGEGSGGGGRLPTATFALPATYTPTPAQSPTPGPSPTRSICQVTASSPTVNEFYTELQWTVANVDAVTISNMNLKWPVGSGILLNIIIDNITIPLNIPAPETTISGFQLSPMQDLAPGNHTFIFQFDNNPLAGVFQVSMTFSNSNCSLVGGALTLYPVTHSGTYPNASKNSYTAGPWSIYNHANKDLIVNYVKITWNDAQNCFRTTNLTAINLGNNVSNLVVDKLNCNGYTLFPVNWIIPAGTTTMNLTFSGHGISKITVELGLTGKINSPSSYILDSSNPQQKQ